MLHNTNLYAPIPLAHSTVMEEKHGNMGVLLQNINYDTHQWQMCGDLKILTILLGQQSEFTKTVEVVQIIIKKWPTVKAFDKTGQYSQYLVKKFPTVSEAKLKGVFDGPQIRTIFRDTTFVSKGFSNREVTVSYLYMNAPLKFFNELSMSKR